MFTNPTIQSTFTAFDGTSFGALSGFEMYSSPNALYYYVMDYWNGVYILNDQWSFISFKVFTNPYNMINIRNSLYMTGKYNIWKLDQDLNILINYNPGGDPNYLGINYNPSNGFIYVASTQEIQVLNLNLTLIRRISTSPRTPYSITISSNILYVGAYGGMIRVYKNESLINQFNGCNGNSNYLTSILFDSNGYMATSCYDSYKLYLFSSNGSFTGQSITSSFYYPRYIGFDSKGRFIQMSMQQISIYN